MRKNQGNPANQHPVWQAWPGWRFACLLMVMGTVGIISAPVRAEEPSDRPYAIFVNGFLDCCAWNTQKNSGSQGMTVLQTRLEQELGAEIRRVPYSSFTDQGTHIGAFGELASMDVDLSNKGFIRQGADFINQNLDPNRPLILIGHSFGGNSVLKLLPEISHSRKILFVGILDPVGPFGLRKTVRSSRIPGNVGYFYHRWQMNGFPPVDYRKSGRIFGCQAHIKCDQADLSLREVADVPAITATASPSAPAPAPPVRDSTIYNRSFLCNQFEQVGLKEKVEFLCPPGVQPVAVPANAIAHSNMPVLPEVQQQMGDILVQLLTRDASGAKDLPSSAPLASPEAGSPPAAPEAEE
ncbi:hypothetical protein [Lyngbya confervoides]|uniref:Alpha/beta hydrolase family protein n=1 Tax=Lyngbya confervoides BDU141951 TaxID=1574623 RepID=A0ABD4T087_9CYAN|nr:hypothetical protein [Lyngbya confervoides]MCM1981717.1 hypothetical protein [Lyngbya confervoides BDU141951]